MVAIELEQLLVRDDPVGVEAVDVDRDRLRPAGDHDVLGAHEVRRLAVVDAARHAGRGTR